MKKFRLYHLLCLSGFSLVVQQQNISYPFQDQNLDPEERIDNLLSLRTIVEKGAALGMNPSVPGLGVKGAGHVEGLHGLALGCPAGWAGEGIRRCCGTGKPDGKDSGDKHRRV